MQLASLTQTSLAVGAESGRRAKVALLSGCIADLDPGEVRLAVTLLSGELPTGKLGVGYATLAALDVPPAAKASLGLRELEGALAEIAGVSGAGAKRTREERLAALLARCTAEEQAFVRALLVGELRQGALEGVMQDAIARAFEVPLAAVRRATMLRGDLAEVAHTARAEGLVALERYRIQLLRPLSPMLAQSAEDVESTLGGMPMAFEHKLDGARIQVHRDGDEVRVFTRQLNDVTARVPELVERVRVLPLSRVVLDGEALALRPDGRPQPFQVSMRRFGRSKGVDAARKALPLHTFFFDCLHLDGDDLIDRTQRERVQALAERTEASERVARIVTADPAQARDFLASALSAGHEGVMAKDLESAYEAGRRGSGWTKVKPVHTFDLVVLAVEWGSGRRKGFLSNIHLGARRETAAGFAMIGKTFKGMTDAMLKWQTERFLSLEVAREGHVVHLRPEQVVEVAFDGVQRSPHYDSGLALRFARVRRYREDKTAAQADTLESVRAFAALDS